MRVISGSAKGRILQAVPGDSTRPITDKVKEAAFNIFGGDIIDAVFLDLFGGTGGVGIEALSRGAARAVFVEKNRKALELFKGYDVVTAKQIGDLFGFQPRTNAALCKKWVERGFLEIVDYSNKARKYKLAEPYDVIVKESL